MSLGRPNLYPGIIGGCPDPRAHLKKAGMRNFRVYRENPPEGYRESGTANPPDEVQFEGVVFSDGTVCVRWQTEYRSHSLWNSLEDLEKVHGHPEYGSRWEWE